MALRAVGITLVLLAAAPGGAAAWAQAPPPSPVDFAMTFGSTRPGTPTDAKLYILYKDPENPSDPSAKPPALTSVTIAAPPGTVLDGTAVPACEASDEELMLMGPAACPRESDVGGGFGSVQFDPGPPDPFRADVALFNYGDGIIELFTFNGAVHIVDRARFVGRDTMVLHPAVVPGVTEREFSFDYRGTRGSDGRALITTPPDCPPTGVWSSRLTYTVTTGATYTARSTTPCTPAAARRAGLIRVSLTPARVPAGRRARIRVRLRSRVARCVAGAAIGVPGRRAVRTDRAGRATLVATFRRPGRRTLTATKKGCAAGRATLTVTRSS